MRVSSGSLHRSVERLLIANELPPAHARDVADVLVETSLQGIDTHGVRLLPVYLRELQGGRANVRPQFRAAGAFPCARLFDADNALGIVAASAAMRMAIEMASAAGIAAVAIANSNHFGAAGYYARMAAHCGQIGIVCTNSDALVVPFGGTVPLNGTNPIAVGAPGIGEDGFYLDMATSQISFTSALNALCAQENASGTGDATPFEAMARSRSVLLQPLGGHKGQGLGTVVQILCALLSGMPLDRDLANMYRPPYDEPRRISHFMIAIRIDAFTELPEFRTRLSQLLADFRSSAGVSGAVVAAGDLERRTRAIRLTEGIDVDGQELELLQPYLEEAPEASSLAGAPCRVQ